MRFLSQSVYNYDSKKELHGLSLYQQFYPLWLLERKKKKVSLFIFIYLSTHLFIIIIITF